MAASSPSARSAAGHCATHSAIIAAASTGRVVRSSCPEKCKAMRSVSDSLRLLSNRTSVPCTEREKRSKPFSPFPLRVALPRGQPSSDGRLF